MNKQGWYAILLWVLALLWAKFHMNGLGDLMGVVAVTALAQLNWLDWATDSAAGPDSPGR